jgi:hypothetical protein
MNRGHPGSMPKYALLLVFRQRWPYFGADGAVQPRDHEIRPAVALAREQQLGNRDTQPALQLRQRSPLRDELVAMDRRKDLQDRFIAETDDEVGTGREDMRRCRLQTVTVCDIEGDWQPARLVGAPGAEGFETG